MASLIGYLEGSRGQVSRLGSKRSGITATLQTWGGKVYVHLASNGEFRVEYGEMDGPKNVLNGKVPGDKD